MDYLQSGQEIGKYRILRPIGQGGMADVYEAEDMELGRRVALKVLPPEFARDPERVSRFIREVRHSAQLQHPHIVPVYDVGEAGGAHFYTMALLEGGDLKARIGRGMSADEALSVVRCVADALGAAHAKGIVHRDVKPENILFDADGRPVLTDLGIARAMSSGTRMTKTGMSIGTPHYMSPEQARGREVDGRSDLYSLGVLLFEMLTGQVPYDAEETFAIGLKHISDPLPVLPDSLRMYQPLLDLLLAKEPEQRFQNAADCMAGIDEIRQTGSLRSVYPPQPAISGQALRPLVATLIGAVLALLLGGAGWWYLHTPAPHLGGGGGMSVAQSIVPSSPAKRAARSVTPPPAAQVRPAPPVPPLPEAEPAVPSAEKGSVPVPPAQPEPVTEPVQETVLDPPAPVFGALRIESTPDQALVLLDGQEAGQTPVHLDRVAEGPHRVELRKRYFVSRELNASVAAGSEARLHADLVRSTVEVTVNSTPPGATVVVDKTSRYDKTPVSFNLPAGEHDIALELAGHGPAERHVDLEQGAYDLALSLEALGKLYVDVTPADARIKVLHIRPVFQQGMELAAGRYELEVSAPGFETVKQWVDVAGGAEAKPAIVLQPSTGTLVVESSQSGGQLSLDGRELGALPGRFEAVPGGRHELRVTLDGYKPWSHTVDIRSGQTTSVAVTLVVSGPAPGRPWTDPVTGMEFVWVPGGCYQMGSNSGESDEKPVHEVCVDGFWMGKYEVTQAEWKSVMGSNSSNFKGDRNPVEQVSWNDAQAFSRKLSGRGNGTFRLPTEAEWEYAARSGGRDEKYAGGNSVDRVAWYAGNSGRRTHTVGTKAPNGLGLYDMSGNVWEWCQDWYADSAYAKHSRNNPIYAGGGSYRVFRGGGWYNNAVCARAAFRLRGSPGFRSSFLGFRLVRTK